MNIIEPLNKQFLRCFYPLTAFSECRVGTLSMGVHKLSDFINLFDFEFPYNLSTFFFSWSPLHEASWNGHLECVKALLSIGLAPLKSRTNKDETPADLAKANSKKDIAEFLDNWDWPNCNARYGSTNCGV